MPKQFAPFVGRFPPNNSIINLRSNRPESFWLQYRKNANFSVGSIRESLRVVPDYHRGDMNEKNLAFVRAVDCKQMPQKHRITVEKAKLGSMQYPLP